MGNWGSSSAAKPKPLVLTGDKVYAGLHEDAFKEEDREDFQELMKEGIESMRKLQVTKTILEVVERTVDYYYEGKSPKMVTENNMRGNGVFNVGTKTIPANSLISVYFGVLYEVNQCPKETIYSIVLGRFTISNTEKCAYPWKTTYKNRVTINLNNIVYPPNMVKVVTREDTVKKIREACALALANVKKIEKGNEVSKDLKDAENALLESAKALSCLSPLEEKKRPLSIEAGDLSVGHRKKMSGGELKWREMVVDGNPKIPSNVKELMEKYGGSYYNHRCDGENAVFLMVDTNGHLPFIVTKTLRDIEPGEEITVDYGGNFVSDVGGIGFKLCLCEGGHCPKNRFLRI